MLDPESAIFEDVEARDNNTEVCGRVKGRNAFGGMTGFQSFKYYPAGDKAHVTSPSDPIESAMARC
jgi:hypothetical protein